MRRKIIRLYKRADKKGFALGAFNFSNNEILKGIVSAAKKLKAPIIISTSEGERTFFGLEESVAAYHVIRKKYPPVVLHADHTRSFEEVRKVVDAGYPSVHFDGSDLAFRHNLRETKKAAAYARAHNVFIEGELGAIKGSSTTHREKLKDTVAEELLTRPEQAEEFVRLTGVDSLAVSIGNAHGVWQDKPSLDFERLKQIKEKTGSFLVLHGGSGISAKNFRKAIILGINKININTELRMAYAHSLLRALHQRKDYTPYHYLADVERAVAEVVDDKIKVFGADNKIKR